MWVVRHGERADVADGDWWLTAPQPHNPPLTELGIQQAEATGRALAGEHIEHIFVSPFRRCIQTAIGISEQMAAASGTAPLKVKIEPGLGEMLHHDWFDFPAPAKHPREGNPTDATMSLAAILAEFGKEKIDASYDTPLYDVAERRTKPLAARSTTELYTFPEEWHEGVERYQACLRRLQEASPYSVLVSHGAGVQACAESVEGIDMEDMEIGYCCLTNLTRQGNYAWKMGVLASTRHQQGIEGGVLRWR